MLLSEYVVINQGGFGVIEVTGDADRATATFDGRTHQLLARPGGFWGVIGADAFKPAGVYDLAVTLSGGGGVPLTDLAGAVEVVATGFPVETITLAPEESALLDPSLAAQEAATREQIYAQFTPEQLWVGPFVPPSAAPVSSPYGIGRSYNSAPVSSYHSGTDFAAEEGAPVTAANAGRVVFVDELPIRGRSVVLDHGGGVFTAYHHLSRTAASLGGTVATGDVLGFVGATGLSTGPHLHWELIVGGENVDPMLWTLEAVGPTG